MKKILFLALLVGLMAVPAMVYADDQGAASAVVGDNVQVGQDEVKITEVDPDSAVSTEAPLERVPDIKPVHEGQVIYMMDGEESAPVVGDDITVNDDQVKIVSIDEGQPLEPVNETLPEAYESNIRTMTAQKAPEKHSNTLYYGLGLGILVLLASGTAYKKLAQH